MLENPPNAMSKIQKISCYFPIELVGARRVTEQRACPSWVVTVRRHVGQHPFSWLSFEKETRRESFWGTARYGQRTIVYSIHEITPTIYKLMLSGSRERDIVSRRCESEWHSCLIDTSHPALWILINLSLCLFCVSYMWMPRVVQCRYTRGFHFKYVPPAPNLLTNCDQENKNKYE